MSTTTATCGDCEAFLAARPENTRRHWVTLRDYLNDRATADSQPHKHVPDATSEDLEACDRALQKEMDDLKRAYQLVSLIATDAQLYMEDGENMREFIARCQRTRDAVTWVRIAELVNELLSIEESRTSYLSKQRAIYRTSDGAE
jgi:hypothetical protein